MAHKNVDYDSLAGTYDRRFAGEQRSGTLAALLELFRSYQPARILEVGCGTAHWLAKLREDADAEQVFGIDLSAGMLAQARQREIPLHLIRGRAERLPFPCHSFDLIYCVNALHHFDQQATFIQDAFQILKPGGLLAVIGMDPRQQRDKWYIYDYFKGVYDTDLDRFPSWGRILDWLIEAGFELGSYYLVERISHPKSGIAVLDDPFLCKQACSQLAMLSEKAYENGLENIRAALSKAKMKGEHLIFNSEIKIYMLAAHKAINPA